MLRKHMHRDSLVALLTLLVSACSDSPEPADAPEPPAAAEQASSVERVSQALGSFTQLWSGVNGETPLFVNTVWTAFKHVSAGCDRVDAIETVTGMAKSVAALPTCSTVTAAGGDATLFVGTSAQKIYALHSMGPMAGAGGSGSYDWTEIVSTSGANISKIVVDATNVYWQDSSGIYRAPRGGGTSTTLTSSNRTLLAVDGSVLWVQRDDGGGQWSLRTVGTGNGLPELTKITNTMPFAPGFWVEDSYTWWVENGAADGYNRLRRFDKAAGTFTAIKLLQSVTYHLPMRSGTVLYWIERNISTGAVTMRSRNMTTNVEASSAVGVLDVLHMAVGTSVYFTAETSASPLRYNLQKGTL